MNIEYPLRIELMNTISKHTPFSPITLNNVLESAKSLDFLFDAIEYASINAVDLYTARDKLLRQDYER